MGILSGILVVDLSRVLAGPYLTMSLGDLGADVIKIESPMGGDETRSWGPPFAGDDSSYYLAINRNKRSVTANLKTVEGREIVYSLVKKADIVVDNFRQETRQRLGMDYETLESYNPRIIMLTISAFGEDGPYQRRPGYDILAQAMGGLMSLTGEENGPPIKAGFPVADLGTGLFGLSGILAALFHRERTGKGMYLTTSLFESQLSFHINWAMNYFLSGEEPRRMGSAHPNLAPYQAFPTANGYIIIACGNDGIFAKLCAAINREDLAQDPRFTTNGDRVARREELAEELRTVLVHRNTTEWCDLFDRIGVPAGPIATIPEIYHEPQVEALGTVSQVNHPVAGQIPQIRFPVHFGSEDATVHRAPPLLGQDTEEILTDLGLDEYEIQRFRDSGII